MGDRVTWFSLPRVFPVSLGGAQAAPALRLETETKQTETKPEDAFLAAGLLVRSSVEVPRFLNEPSFLLGGSQTSGPLGF